MLRTLPLLLVTLGLTLTAHATPLDEAPASTQPAPATDEASEGDEATEAPAEGEAEEAPAAEADKAKGDEASEAPAEGEAEETPDVGPDEAEDDAATGAPADEAPAAEADKAKGDESAIDIEDPNAGRFRLGLGLTTFSELGFGVLVRARFGDYGMDVVGSVAPEYFINSGTPCSPVRFEFPLRLTVSGLAYFHKEEDLEHGMRLGFIYNTIYEWGAILGYRIEYAFNDYLSFEAGTGVIIHPIGHELVTGHLANACGDAAKPSATSELTNRIWIYFGAGLTLYLF